MKPHAWAEAVVAQTLAASGWQVERRRNACISPPLLGGQFFWLIVAESFWTHVKIRRRAVLNTSWPGARPCPVLGGLD
jgi:hypothetical protein